MTQLQTYSCLPTYAHSWRRTLHACQLLLQLLALIALSINHCLQLVHLLYVTAGKPRICGGASFHGLNCVRRDMSSRHYIAGLVFTWLSSRPVSRLHIALSLFWTVVTPACTILRCSQLRVNGMDCTGHRLAGTRCASIVHPDARSARRAASVSASVSALFYSIITSVD